MLINHQKMFRIERYGPNNVSRHPASGLVEKICMFEFRKNIIIPRSRSGLTKSVPETNSQMRIGIGIGFDHKFSEKTYRESESESKILAKKKRESESELKNGSL